MDTLCKGCGQTFGCDVDNIKDNGSCWCMTRIRIKELPPLPVDLNFKQASCYCETCLNKQTGSRLQHLYQQYSLPELVEIAQRYQNNGPLVEHIDFTIEQGFHVFSRWFHLKRGTCCGNGCKHCPYGNSSAD